jgi:hypothetical protein
MQTARFSLGLLTQIDAQHSTASVACPTSVDAVCLSHDTVFCVVSNQIGECLFLQNGLLDTQYAGFSMVANLEQACRGKYIRIRTYIHYLQKAFRQPSARGSLTSQTLPLVWVDERGVFLKL